MSDPAAEDNTADCCPPGCEASNSPEGPDDMSDKLADENFDNEFDDDYPVVQPALSPFDRILFCRHCGRPETHSWQLRRRWYYWVLWPIPTVVLRLFGPYRCRCCGRFRSLGFNL